MRLALLALTALLFLQVKPPTPERPREDHRATSSDSQSTAQKQSDSSKDIGASPNADNIAKGDEQQADTDKMDERRDRKTQLRLNCIYVWATVVGVIGGWVVLGVLIYQTILTRRSVNVAKASLVSTFRPEIIVRSVTLQVPFRIRCVIANRGGTAARVLASNVTVADITKPFPPLPPYSKESEFFGKGTIAPGGFIERIIPMDAATVAQVKSGYTRKQGGATDPGSVHFLGYVQYQDDNGIIRYMAFCRLFNVQTDRFEAVKDSDYEYAD